MDAFFNADDNGNVTLFHDQLKKILSNAEKIYKSKPKETKYGHRKFYAGEFDVSDINEIFYLIIIEVFKAQPDSSNCICINGIQSKLPIMDKASLLKNISYFADVFMNDRGKRTFKEMPDDNAYADGKHDSVMLEVDKQSIKNYSASLGNTGFKWKYAFILRYLQKNVNNVFDLFNSDSVVIHAIIKTIIEREDTFVYICGGYQMVTGNELCRIIYDHTSVKVQRNNLNQCLKTIERKLLNYLLMIDGKHELILKYDAMQLDSIHDSLNLVSYEEALRMLEVSREYRIDNFKDTKMVSWDAYVSDSRQRVKIKFYSNQYVKHPIEKTVSFEDLMIYEGIKKYYICDKKNMVMYILPKDCRKELQTKIRKIA